MTPLPPPTSQPVRKPVVNEELFQPCGVNLFPSDGPMFIFEGEQYSDLHLRYTFCFVSGENHSNLPRGPSGIVAGLTRSFQAPFEQ